jgi:hypothetical protein
MELIMNQERNFFLQNDEQSKWILWKKSKYRFFQA